VPNFSEGRRPEVVDEIVAAIAAVDGVSLLDRQSDPAHNRSVVTFAGLHAAVAEGAFRGVAAAVRLIDLTEHEGAHPRMGAADVVPFVPLKSGDMSVCVDVAHAVGARIAGELGVPVYFYEEAARREMAEEVGLDSGLPLRTLFDARIRNAIESENTRVFAVTHEGPFRPQAEEIDALRFWSPEEVTQALGTGVFTPNLEAEIATLRDRGLW